MECEKDLKKFTYEMSNRWSMYTVNTVVLSKDEESSVSRIRLYRDNSIPNMNLMYFRLIRLNRLGR